MANLQSSLDAVDAATTRIGSSVTVMSGALDQASIRVDAVMQKLKTGMTAEEVASARAALDAATTRMDVIVTGLDGIVPVLNGLAADPVVPVPEPVPDPPVIPPLPTA